MLNLYWLKQLEAIDNFTDCIVPQNKRNTILVVVFFFMFIQVQKNSARKTDLIVSNNSKRKQNLEKKGRALFNTPKQTCVQNLELFW